MSEDAKRFRQRAVDCRAIASGTKNQADATLLEEMADELDAEADKIDSEEEARAGGAKPEGA
jgi:hypothetical protein